MGRRAGRGEREREDSGGRSILDGAEQRLVLAHNDRCCHHTRNKAIASCLMAPSTSSTEADSRCLSIPPSPGWGSLGLPHLRLQHSTTGTLQIRTPVPTSGLRWGTCFPPCFRFHLLRTPLCCRPGPILPLPHCNSSHISHFAHGELTCYLYKTLGKTAVRGDQEQKPTIVLRSRPTPENQSSRADLGLRRVPHPPRGIISIRFPGLQIISSIGLMPSCNGRQTLAPWVV